MGQLHFCHEFWLEELSDWITAYVKVRVNNACTTPITQRLNSRAVQSQALHTWEGQSSIQHSPTKQLLVNT